MRKNNNKQRGSALVLAMIITGVALTLAVALLGASQSSGRVSAKRANNEIALRIAEAGLHHAAISLSTNWNYAGDVNRAFGAGTFTVAVSPISANQRLVIATSNVVYARGLSVKKTLRSLVDLGNPPSINNYAIVSKGPLQMKGNVHVASAPQPGQGNIGSNASVSLVGHVQVGGSATSTGAVAVTGASNVTSGLNAFVSQPISFPPLNFPALKWQAQANKVTNGNVSINSSGTTVLTGLINGNLTIGGGGHVVIQSPVYVTGTINLNGALVDGGTLISDGDVSASGNNGVTSGGTLALVTQANFSLTGNASIVAGVYAPNGDISLGGNSSIFGTAASNTMTMHGTPTITRNTNFVWPSEFVPTHMGYYQE